MGQIKFKDKGRVSRIFPSIGFVESLSSNETYEFTIPKEIKLNVDDIISFDLKQKEKSKSIIASNLQLVEKKKTSSKKAIYEFENFSEKKYVMDEVAIPLLKEIIEDSTRKENRRKLTKGSEEDLVTLFEECEILLNSANENLENENLDLTDFVIKLQEITSRKNVFKSDISFIWKQWKDNEKEFFEYENNEGLISYTDWGALGGGREQIHEYEKMPGKIHWRLVKIQQKDKVFYIASAPVWEIARTSYVPSLPPKLGIGETADRILDRTKKQDEWQREAEVKRIRKIRDFIGRSNNIIANAPMLYITDSKHAHINNKNGDQLTIDFSFLNKRNNVYVDRYEMTKKDEFGNTQYKDFRPMWLIDGQHRIKGIHQNTKESQKLKLPIVIFPKEFGPSDTAKVFAEINTLQEPLPDLHELFMQHRFKIDHVSPKKKFIDYRGHNLRDFIDDGGIAEDWLNSRSNTLSYEILAKLSKKGALKNRVKFLNQNDDAETKLNILIDAKQWINYTRSWFNKPYEYNSENDLDSELEIYFQEIYNYFEAWVETCNHNEWGDKEKRWTEKSNKKGLIQQKLYFIVLLNLFSLIYSIAKRNKKSAYSKLTKEDFKNTLLPFKWVDWTHSELRDKYRGGGEKGRGSLEVWMADAILDYDKNKILHDKNEIIDEDIKSMPGRGITSALKEAKIEMISENHWPKKNKPVKFKCLRPHNARYKSEWRVLKGSNGNEVNVSSKSGDKYVEPEDSEFEIKYEKWMEKETSIIVECSWFNARTETPKPTYILSKFKYS